MFGVLILFASLSMFGYANSLFTDHYTPQPLKQLSADPKEVADCANFSGTWKGKCSGYSGGIVEITSQITQLDCSVILINNFLINIGGQNTSDYATKEAVLRQTYYLDWDKVQTNRLNSIASITGRNFNIMPGQQRHWILEETGHLSIFGTRLHTTSVHSGKLFIDGSPLAEPIANTIRCTLDKQP